jgi:hypothetical protein
VWSKAAKVFDNQNSCEADHAPEQQPTGQQAERKHEGVKAVWSEAT